VIPYFQIKAYIRHWLHVVDEHSIHSPFFFDFYEKVIRNKNKSESFEDIERVRKKLLESAMEIDVQDLGASSAYFKNEKRTLSRSLQPVSAPRQSANSCIGLFIINKPHRLLSWEPLPALQRFIFQKI
jgi:hypothetical protein